MPNNRSKRAPRVSQTASSGKHELATESLAHSRIRPLWQPGDLFHNFSRFPERRDMRRVDRLARILANGLIAPASCDDGSVRSDLNIVVIGAPVPYDSLVFLHRFGPKSGIYLLSRPGRFTVLVEPGFPVLTPQDMGPNWVVTCRDEVYVRDKIAPQYLSGLVVHPADVNGVLRDFLPNLRALGMPVYLMDGTVVWPSAQRKNTSRNQKVLKSK
ncbi:hypothetical protein L0337_29135 [candidate division KSB1 bacterium]|nr:hypothetical protein [candidate division KSB1 bacterium]